MCATHISICMCVGAFQCVVTVPWCWSKFAKKKSQQSQIGVFNALTSPHPFHPYHRHPIPITPHPLLHHALLSPLYLSSSRSSFGRFFAWSSCSVWRRSVTPFDALNCSTASSRQAGRDSIFGCTNRREQGRRYDDAGTIEGESERSEHTDESKRKRVRDEPNYARREERDNREIWHTN